MCSQYKSLIQFSEHLLSAGHAQRIYCAVHTASAFEVLLCLQGHCPLQTTKSKFHILTEYYVNRPTKPLKASEREARSILSHLRDVYMLTDSFYVASR